MVSSKAATVEEYIAELPPDRRGAISRVRNTYNGQPLGYAALASQKNYMSLYLNNVYGDPETEAWFRERYAASGHRLDMGKSCVHFRRAEDLPLDVIGETIARTSLERYVARYLAVRGR